MAKSKGSMGTPVQLNKIDMSKPMGTEKQRDISPSKINFKQMQEESITGKIEGNRLNR